MTPVPNYNNSDTSAAFFQLGITVTPALHYPALTYTDPYIQRALYTPSAVLPGRGDSETSPLVHWTALWRGEGRGVRFDAAASA